MDKYATEKANIAEIFEKNKVNISLEPRLAVPTCRILEASCRAQHYAEHVQKRKLHG